MDPIAKELSNPFSTGGGGFQFETHVQASFVILMLVDGFVPGLPTVPIKKIKFQGKIDGFQTDDLIVFMEKPDGHYQQKLLGQIKHSVAFTASDSNFRDVIMAAWRDYSNSSLFTKKQDAIAVITGPLSAADIEGARWILEWARSCETAQEFIRNVETAIFSSQLKNEKLAAFRGQLAKANNNIELSDDQLFEFLRHFHILSYDLDIKSGVALSLLHSLITQYTVDNVRAIWALVVDEVQTANKNAGTLTKDNLPHELREAFQRQRYATIPASYAPTVPERVDFNQFSHASTIAVANLIGSWDEKRSADCNAIGLLTGDDFSKWIVGLQEVLQTPNNPLRLRDGEWHVADRPKVWQSLGQRIFDRSLDAFRLCVRSVLSERDPKFELPSNERFGAAIRGKELSFSRAIRKGLAETLALMGANPNALSNCSDGKVRTVAILSVRELLLDADWVTWGSLNPLLPLLAEAAPEEFMKIVENALDKSTCPFDLLFLQEGDGILGDNYLTGLLWALESLAWDEKYLVAACVLLSSLAAKDPGGHSGNRPFNSLVTILLPWLPQTDAPFEKRIVAIQTIAKEEPEIAWKLLMSLLPKQQQMSMRSHRPIFRTRASSSPEREVTQSEYWKQINFYSNMVMELANGDVEKLIEIAEILHRLPFENVAVFANKLALIKPTSVQAASAADLWKALKRYISKHTQLTEQQSTQLPEVIASLEVVANSLAPKNPAQQYQQLFGHNDPEFYSHSGESWEEKGKKQGTRRQQAIREILAYGGLTAVVEFVDLADEALIVGDTLGRLADDQMDIHFLPVALTSDNRRMQQFLFGYVRARFHREGWKWVKQLSIANWSRTEIGKFFSLLPFRSDIWEEVSESLGNSDEEYWLQVNPNPFEASDGLDFAVCKLIDNGRPALAIACLNRAIHDKQPLNVREAERALLGLLDSGELSKAADKYDVLAVIKALQEDPSADSKVVGKLEWQFLQLLDRDLGMAPKLLEQRLASDPAFFCEVIRSVYRSENQPKESRIDPTPQEQVIAKNAYTLLHDWQTPPGLNSDGSFSPEAFRHWLAKTREIAADSGHLSVALTHVGCVLYYSPKDPNGLWIDRSIAEALNDKTADKLRTGFVQQIFNSRGVHWVDPSGQQERELSEQYQGKAEDVENAGYQRLATSLRALAESYAREAEQVMKQAEAE
ncbi:MAG: hypothetical protein JSS83_19435 [Cyanobacteria bacterium SZAS LIN-3]|nr:hypothetical protein [Cyanobacteria bacterium SZAS LIN-3]MBS2010347.1 hypothetical protein [Cyanobacteria bacterium SZAS TMP-1]